MAYDKAQSECTGHGHRRGPNVCPACQEDTTEKDLFDGRKFCPSCRAFVCEECLETCRVDRGLFRVSDYYCPVCHTKLNMD
jgi:hypothetical protein